MKITLKTLVSLSSSQPNELLTTQHNHDQKDKYEPDWHESEGRKARPPILFWLTAKNKIVINF